MKNKLEEIYEGWKNYAFPNDNVETEAKKRIAICVKCNLLTKRMRCSKCGCYMPAKVRSLKSKCPIKKW